MKQQRGFMPRGLFLRGGGDCAGSWRSRRVRTRHAEHIRHGRQGRLWGQAGTSRQNGSTAQAKAMSPSLRAMRNPARGKHAEFTRTVGREPVSPDFLAGNEDFGGSDFTMSGAKCGRQAALRHGTDDGTCCRLSVDRDHLQSQDDRRLNFDAPTVAKILQRSHQALGRRPSRALNGNMPAEEIHVIYRSDDPRTSDNFQQYLQGI